ncbi:guanylate kinase [Candidatus Vondammii sp. HM_W22]|uniref:guanylate kinase n=1 Tax=Candidatus Vondammii sp. HM_W22 TaxID=2687299 RepID=UPI001F12C76C|nr:guanylate kinase [Candidatus Vondammii sp. HM_W22]
MTIGTLFIVSAPSGAGKTSLVKALLKTEEMIEVSVSYTTRPMRPGEKNSVDYHFVDLEQFTDLVRQGAFLENAQVFDNYYGTSEVGIRNQLNRGDDVVLEIDWQGAHQVRERMPNTVSIFILPPTLEALWQRLSGRGQDSIEVVERRMRDARDEMSHYGEYDFIIVNDDFNQALEELRSVILGQRFRQSVQRERLQHQLAALLA